MSALKFIDLLSKQEVVADKVIKNLRTQVESSDKPVQAKAVAQLLVKKGLLTVDQAKRLLSKLESSPPPPPPKKTYESDLGLADEVSADEELGPAEDDDIVDPVEEVEILAHQPPTPPKVDEPMDGGMWDSEGAEQAEDDAADEALDEFSEAAEAAENATTVVRRKKGIAALFGAFGRGGPKKFTANRWDSPLMLAGGGLLLLLILAGLGLYFFLTRGTGDDAFSAATEQYRAQAYTQAAGMYRSFVSDYKDHPKVSLARVRIGMSEIWNLVERQRWVDALEAVETRLPEIEGEEDFSDARPELASLLPEIMDGFADLALDAEDIPSAEENLGLANQTLGHVNNSAYLPTSVRAGQQARIDDIEKKLQSVEHRINQDRELERVVGEIEQFAADQRFSDAYASRKKLIRTYPELEVDSRLVEAISAVSETEKGNAKPLDSPPSPTTDEAPTDARFSITLSNTRGNPGGASSKKTIAIVASGAAYGIDVDSGKVAWRRFVGFGGDGLVLDLQEGGLDAVVLADYQRNEVVCVEVQSGALKWRLPCPGRINPPQLTGGAIFVSGTDEGNGYLLSVDPSTGEVKHGVSLAIPLTVGPVADVDAQRLIQPADEASVYLFSLNDLSCLGVTYTGHASGTIDVPPTVVAGFTLIAENPGIDFSLLHVFSYDDEADGRLKTRLDQPLRFSGQTVYPMSVLGRRILTTSDRGSIKVLEIDPDQPTPIREAAQANSTVQPGTISFPLVDRGRLWVGDSQLTQFELQRSTGRLVQKWLNSKGDRFVAPMRLVGDRLVHVRVRDGKSGITVAATNVDGGSGTSETIWETDLAVPMAGTPFVADKRIRVVTHNGELYSLGNAALKSGLQASADQVLSDPKLPRIIDSLTLANGKRVFVAESGDRAVVYDAQNASLTTVPLELGGQTAAATPIAVGDNVLVASNGGAVSLVNPQDGTAAVTPYQTPNVGAGRTEWYRPAAVSAQQAVVADRRGNLLQLMVQSDPQPHLNAVLQQTNVGLIAAPVVAGDAVWGVVKGAEQDLARQFGLDDLQQRNQVELGGRRIWGPFAAGELLLVQNDQFQLLAADSSGSKKFLTEPLGSAIVGIPIVYENGFVVATVEGKLHHLSNADGATVNVAEVGETLAGSPALYSGNRFMVSGHDGTLHVVILE